MTLFMRRSPIEPLEHYTTPKKEKLATRSIRVSGLAPTLPKSWLESTFKNFGEILGIEVSDEKDTAYVHFISSEAAGAACQEMNEESVEGQVLHVELFQRHSSPESPVTSPASELPAVASTQSKGKKLVSIKLSNISKSVVEATLLKICQIQVGFTDLKLVQVNDGLTNYAWVNFSSDCHAVSAQKALNGIVLADLPIRAGQPKSCNRTQCHMAEQVPECGVDTKPEIPKTFSFKLTGTQLSTMALPKGEKSSLFQPIRYGLDLSTAHNAMLNTLPQEQTELKPSQTQSSTSVHVDGHTAEQQTKVFSNVSGRKQTTLPQQFTKTPSIKEHIKQSTEPTLVNTQLGRASMFKKSTSMPTKTDVLRNAEGSGKYTPKHVQVHTQSSKTQLQPALKYSLTEPHSLATAISSTSVDHSGVRGGVSVKLPSPVTKHTQTEPTASDSKGPRRDIQNDDGSGEGGDQIPEEDSLNPFKQALARRPSLVSQTATVLHKQPKKQAAPISEIFKFSDPLVKRALVQKYNSELKALQKKYKVSIMGEEVDGVAVTLSCSSPGNLKKAKMEITALVAQANISDDNFTVSCGSLPCLADPDTVTLLQTIEKQNTTEFTIVTNTCEMKLKECCETLKSKISETKGPLCLLHVPDFTEIRLGYLWKVRNSSTNDVIGFEIDVNEQINSAYIKRESTYSFVYNGHSYIVDFSRMTVTDKTDGGQVYSIIKEPVWCRYGGEEFGYKHMRETISAVIEEVFQRGASGFAEIEGHQFVLDFDSKPMQAYSIGQQAVPIQREPEVTSLEHVFTVKVRGITENIPAAKDAFHGAIRSKLTTETLTIPPSFNKKVTQLLLLNVARKYCVQCSLSHDKLALQLTGTKEIVANVKADLAQHLLTVLSEPYLPSHSVSPPDWVPQDKDIALCPVAEKSSEWIHIEQLMKKSLKSVKIVTIERIQNKSLWQKYAFFRAHLAKRTSINEMELFHGTRSNPPSKIYESDKGFDFRFGSDKSLWGQGSYFAVNASYSDRGYAYHHSNGQKQLILAKVVTGESVEMRNHEKLKAPPLKPGEEVNRYDTVRAKTRGSEIYVIYDHEKAYPAYVISYRT